MNTEAAPTNTLGWGWFWSMFGTSILLFVILIWYITMWRDPLAEVANLAASKELTVTDHVAVKNEIRKNAFTALGALFIVGTLIVSAYNAVLGARNLGVALKTLRTTERRIDIDRDGQVMERFGRAVELLGSGSVNVRVGGIYALGRVGRDSPADRTTVAEILAAFVRQQARFVEPACEVMEEGPTEQWEMPEHDVGGAVKLLNELGRQGVPLALDLGYTNIQGVTLHWQGDAVFDYSHLQAAEVSATGDLSMTHAVLLDATLRAKGTLWVDGAWVQGATVEGNPIQGLGKTLSPSGVKRLRGTLVVDDVMAAEWALDKQELVLPGGERISLDNVTFKEQEMAKLKRLN